MSDIFDCDPAMINNVEIVESILAGYQDHCNVDFVIELMQEASPESNFGLIKAGEITMRAGQGVKKRKSRGMYDWVMDASLCIYPSLFARGMGLPYALRKEVVEAKCKGTMERHQELYRELCVKEGENGFIDLLRELAPYLETPLTVIAASWDSGEFRGAKEWCVEPGATDVRVQEVHYMHEEEHQLCDFGK